MNIDIEDFKLTPDEVKQLSKFNKNYRLRTPAKWYDHPQFPFEKKNLTKEEIKYIIDHSKEDWYFQNSILIVYNLLCDKLGFVWKHS